MNLRQIQALVHKPLNEPHKAIARPCTQINAPCQVGTPKRIMLGSWLIAVTQHPRAAAQPENEPLGADLPSELKTLVAVLGKVATAAGVGGVSTRSRSRQPSRCRPYSGGPVSPSSASMIL